MSRSKVTKKFLLITLLRELIDKFGSCVKIFVNFYFDPRFIVQTWSYCIKEHEKFKILLTEMRNYDL